MIAQIMDLVNASGIAKPAALVLFVLLVLVWQIFSLRLKLLRKRYNTDLEEREKIHKARFEAVSELRDILHELSLNLSTRNNEAIKDELVIESIEEARQHVRKNSLVLTANVQKQVNALCDYARDVIEEREEYKVETHQDLESNVQDSLDKVLAAFPASRAHIGKRLS